MMKVILWRKPDGGFAYTLCKADDALVALAEADWLVAHPERNHFGYVAEGVCDDADMPDGGIAKTNPLAAKFRPAWTVENGSPAIDMDLARECHRDRLRAARAPLLAALDIAYQRADEAGNADKKQEIAATKQALRDAPLFPEIEAAQTIEQLAAAIPPELASAEVY